MSLKNSKENLTGNIGEWSEIYTLFKLIADKSLYSGNTDFTKIENLIFPIVKILRDQSNGTYEFAYDNELVVIKGNEDVFNVPIIKFQEQAIALLSNLKKTTNSTFSFPETEEFINSFNCNSIKTKSSLKSDIRIVIHDQRTGTNPELGFSIKSQLGSASTLLNAGKTTNFIFKVEGDAISESDIEYINSLFVTRGLKQHKDIKSRIQYIINKGAILKFHKLENSIFGNNLTLIDSCLPKILAEIVYLFYTSTLSKISDLGAEILKTNPLNYNLETNHPFYSYKIKRFLTDIALGMLPSKVWTGELDATGGYLIVKEDGEILCYHIYNRNEFENYLVANTKLETASSTRHDFGSIYQENGALFFKLNLQIRFIK